MANTALVPQSSNFSDRSELRKLFMGYLQASADRDTLKWENLTTREGLCHNWVYDLYEDSLERIWVGTWGGGLCCYEFRQMADLYDQRWIALQPGHLHSGRPPGQALVGD